MNLARTTSTVVSPQPRVCPRCGATLGGFGPEGLCGACMFDAAIETEEELAATPNLLASGPRRFGDYELLGEIARGGMGVVFKARQVSLNRTIAVKMVLRGEFAGVAELARFRAEAETAARLQHPNIVAIHEVGEHEGQPFFSMDFVDGQSLAQLVGNTPLPATRAAKYLKTIAEVVQYAHEHGVLHRDLKPSNVLIDTKDQPRVTDFGLAKRLEGDASLTVTGQVLGSPNFMPPEQAVGKSEAIGPESDVYSLGAILYHALTGRAPFMAESVPATLRMVAETEPVSPRLLVPSVPVDLETICLKCLQKEPARRYATARELGEDLARFLRDEPIHARPVNRGERFWRWCRRNRALASAGAAVLVLLLVVAIGSPIAALRIYRERLRAEDAGKKASAGETKAKTEAAKSQQVAQFLKSMLAGVGPSVALGRDTTMLKEILDKTAKRVSQDLKDQPEVEGELRYTLGEVYWDLGELEQAESMHRQALQTRRKSLGEEHPEVAKSMARLGHVLWRRGNYTESETMGRAAVAMQRKLLGNESLDLAMSLKDLSAALVVRGKRDEAEKVLREAVAIQRKSGRSHTLEMADTLADLIFVLGVLGKRDEVPALRSENMAIKKDLLGEEAIDYLLTLARSLKEEGKYGEAEAVFRKMVVKQRAILGEKEHPELAKSLVNVGEMLHYQRKWRDAEQVYHDALAMRRRLLGNDSMEVGNLASRLARLLEVQARFAEAEPLYREALAIQEKSSADDFGAQTYQRDVARMLRKQRKFAEAEILLRESLAAGMKRIETQPVAAARSAWELTQVLLEQDKPVEVEQLYGDIFTPAVMSRPQSASFLSRLAPLLARGGRWKEASMAMARLIEFAPDNHSYYHWLAPLLVASGDLDNYRVLCRQALARFASTNDPMVAERMAKACLILPDSGVDLKAVAALAETAVTEGRRSRWFAYHQFVKGLAEYRQGNLENVAEWMQGSLAGDETIGDKSRRIEAHMVLAMTHHKLKRFGDARASLAKGTELAETTLPKLEGGDMSEFWMDWIIAHALIKEAKALIEPNGASIPATTGKN